MADPSSDDEVRTLEAVRQRLTLLRRRIKEIKQSYPAYLLDSEPEDDELAPSDAARRPERTTES